MAEFLPAYESMIVNEGGYKLTNDAVDRGGQTYAGIARKFHPAWEGWHYIDQGVMPDAQLVRDFYREKFWDMMRLNEIDSQRIARTLFDFGVNAGIGTAVKLAQVIVNTTPDGKIGPKTIQALNAADENLFIATYALAKIARYRDIVQRDRTQMKYILGWLNRALKEAAV